MLDATAQHLFCISFSDWIPPSHSPTPSPPRPTPLPPLLSPRPRLYPKGSLENLKGFGKPLKRRGHEVAGLGDVGGAARMINIMAEANVKPESLERLDELKERAAAFRAAIIHAIAECEPPGSHSSAGDGGGGGEPINGGSRLLVHMSHSAAGQRTTLKAKLDALNVLVKQYNSAVRTDVLRSFAF